jgi:sugar-phosphatase
MKVIIFDMDGVLIDSEPFWRKAEVMVYGKYGLELTEDDCKSTTGLRIDRVTAFRFPDASDSWVKDVSDEVVNEVIRLIGMEGELFTGCKELLDWLTEMNVPLGIATSSPLRLAEAVLNRTGTGKYFKTVTSAEFLQHPKPHPEVYLNAAFSLNANPSDCLAIEDSLTGCESAEKAGMEVFHLCTDELMAIDNQLNKFRSHLEILEKLKRRATITGSLY